jgi:hypothetical protein
MCNFHQNQSLKVCMLLKKKLYKILIQIKRLSQIKKSHRVYVGYQLCDFIFETHILKGHRLLSWMNQRMHPQNHSDDISLKQETNDLVKLCTNLKKILWWYNKYLHCYLHTYTHMRTRIHIIYIVQLQHKTFCTHIDKKQKRNTLSSWRVAQPSQTTTFKIYPAWRWRPQTPCKEQYISYIVLQTNRGNGTRVTPRWKLIGCNLKHKRK